ncbi:MAG: hypothetical protein GWO02_15605, partial [Gammaproteobacteria bacterium]|nr:hypothetical protein [Gammaproteobacteria bacterium]
MELAPAAGGNWFGAAAVPAGASQLEFFVQAADAAGNVAVSTDKGRFFDAVPAPAESEFQPLAFSSPVDAAPIENVAKAGARVPVRFELRTA